VFSNLISGLPRWRKRPRIDDVLIIQGEWGRVEEDGHHAWWPAIQNY
jgi:hypothetical protein